MSKTFVCRKQLPNPIALFTIRGHCYAGKNDLMPGEVVTQMRRSPRPWTWFLILSSGLIFEWYSGTLGDDFDEFFRALQ